MCEQNASYLATHSKLGSKKFKQNLFENCSKSTEIAITACKISKLSRGSMPPNPLELFLFLNQLQTCSAGKNTLEKIVEIMPPPFLIFLAAPLLTVVGVM